jgi:hypothetical protein
MKKGEKTKLTKYELRERDHDLIESDSESDDELRRREETEIKKILVQCMKLISLF